MEDTTRLCPECGKVMPPVKYGGRGGLKRFCSERCRVRVYRREHPEYVAKTREQGRIRAQKKASERDLADPRPRCLSCGGELTARRARAKYCNARACQAAQKAARWRSNPPCSVEGCGRGVLARGYCPSHYKSEYHIPRFGATPRKVKTRICPCGAEVVSLEGKQKYCSDVCRHAWRGVERSESKAVVVWERPLHIPVVRSPRVVVVPPKQSRRFGCVCVICGVSFIADGMHATCSPECFKLNKRETLKRNARKYLRRHGKFAIEPSVRLSIYERDGWTCQLCGEETSREYSSSDPKAPTLDHIVPRSLQLVPDDSPSNLRLACALCNSLRGNDVNWTSEAIASVS